MYTNFKYLLLSLIYISCVSLVTAKENDILFNEQICKSTTVRSVKDFNRLLQNCTVVAGHVRIVHMYFTPHSLEQLQPSNIEEITGYLLVYRVEGLDSLEKLFPKLIIIRGVELLYDQYALVVNENRELKNIGLVSLLRVLSGSIRVESNPSLCFTHTINWVPILGNNTRKYYFEMKNNKAASQCPLCYTYKDDIESMDHKRCWSLGKFQRYTSDYYDGKKCNGSSNCLTSCSDNNCRHCINYVTDTGCVNNCLVPKFKLAYKRQCVSDCRRLDLIPFGMECIEKCPKHYREVVQKGKISCVLNCTGNFKVNTLDDLEGLADCTTIQGSLTIELFEINKPIITDLEQAFQNLNEITGYLRIQRSPQIVSLNFFKNLHTIKGDNLIENTYSLYVVDNHHLEELWMKNKHVLILKGRVYFHLNPRLCYDTIKDLKESIKESTEITVTDASRNSNGEGVVCGDVVSELRTNITDFNSTSALIVHQALDADSLILVIGYIYYYKEAHQRNVTKYDGRHGCGRDGWFMDITKSKQNRHILKDLKPATQYAYFVKTMTVVDYHYQTDAISEVQYFITSPATPGPVAKLFSHTISASEIEVYWWPPRQPNGIIEKYILHYETTNITMTIESVTTTSNKKELCQCPKLETELSGATPHVDNYYQKEEVIYIDSILDFLIVKNESKSETSIGPINNESESETSKKPVGISQNTSHAEAYFQVMNMQEQEAKNIQESEKDHFTIIHPYPICNQSNPNSQYQTENKCRPLEYYSDSIEIAGHLHTFTLINLKPEGTYRISMRACVENLPNGCGPERVILAETESKSFESLMASFQFYKL